MTDTPAKSRLQRVRQEPRRRDATVVGVEPIGASMISVTLHSDDFADFSSLGFDDHIKFIFAGSDGTEVKRDITPRRFDPQLNQLTLEFVYHEGGEACTWVRAALLGSKAAVGGPKSSIVIPVDYAWHVLAGDLTAAPAIARRLEELPEGTRCFVVLLASVPEDTHRFASGADVTVEWTQDAEQFLEALRAIALPAGQGFVWAAGEAGLMAQVRHEFVERRGHPRSETRISGYWKPDEQGFHTMLERGVD